MEKEQNRLFVPGSGYNGDGTDAMDSAKETA